MMISFFTASELSLSAGFELSDVPSLSDERTSSFSESAAITVSVFTVLPVSTPCVLSHPENISITASREEHNT